MATKKNRVPIHQLVNNVSEEELNILTILNEAGAATLTELSVKTFSLPDEMSQQVRSLRDKGLVTVKQFSVGRERELLMLSHEGEETIRFLK